MHITGMMARSESWIRVRMGVRRERIFPCGWVQLREINIFVIIFVLIFLLLIDLAFL
jgi:hypothetical protein